MVNKSSAIRLSDEFIAFSEKAQTNRVLQGMDKKTIGHPDLSKLIVKYFKLNNDRYLEFINMENKNG